MRSPACAPPVLPLCQVLCGEGNLVRLAPAGRTIIRPHRPLEGPMCGLVPVAGAAVASSSGLRWNLAATRMEMGGLVRCGKREGGARTTPCRADMCSRSLCHCLFYQQLNFRPWS